MAYEIIEIDGEVLRVCIRGIMRLSDQDALQSAARDLIKRGIKPRVLVVAENFEGWEKGEEWGDIRFLMDYGDDIIKMAIVGDECWKEQAFMFAGKGLRATEIEFFPPSSSKEAELWVRK
ncbi:MAG: STAS/SEC14 domain-containing protein [Methylococcales bacterium]